MDWQLIEKPDRTPEDDEQMIRLVQASLWRWTERGDCADKNLSIGYWQASRVQALVSEADTAQKYVPEWICSSLRETRWGYCGSTTPESQCASRPARVRT